MLRLLATLISAPLIIVFGMIGTKYIALALSLRAAFLLPPILGDAIPHGIVCLSDDEDRVFSISGGDAFCVPGASHL